MAIQFLTRLPVSSTTHLSGELVSIRLRQSLVWFPLIGGMVGAITAGVMVAAEQVWPRIVAVVLALIVEVRLTGAFHEDAVPKPVERQHLMHLPQPHLPGHAGIFDRSLRAGAGARKSAV